MQEIFQIPLVVLTYAIAYLAVSTGTSNLVDMFVQWGYFQQSKKAEEIFEKEIT